MTDFRARGTIMGPAGLTAVFGMGTGVTPPVWSPEKRPAGGQAAPAALFAIGGRSRSRATSARAAMASPISPRVDPDGRGIVGPRRCRRGIGSTRDRSGRARGGAGGRIGVVKRSAVRTGRLRRSPAVHSRPIDLVVFQEPSQLALLETSSWRGLRA